MSLTRRHFVSGAALAATSAALPLDANVEASEPLTQQDDIRRMLDVMERQIGMIRQNLAESEAEPIKSAVAVNMEACVLHHRANMLAGRADAVRRLALGESLAEQRAEYERKRLAARDRGYEARNRLNTMKGYSDLIADGHCSPRSQQLYADIIARECRHLESDIDHVLRLVT